MAFWPFKKRTPPPPPVEDRRVWNEDWRVGDTAECIVGPDAWGPDDPPWWRAKLGERYIVTGFSEGLSSGGTSRHYFLRLEGLPRGISCTSFRKVRPVSAEDSEIGQRILSAKPGADRVREGVE